MRKKNRIVILGSGGFVSSGVEKILKKNGYKLLLLPRKKIDLKNKNSVQKLNKLIKVDDIIFFAAAEAPVKNYKMLLNNLLMAKNVSQVMREKKPNFFLYLSSDAVYADSKKKLSEKSDLIPDSLHGAMHLIREEIFKNLKTKLCIVRPTLIYGKNDPHNGYGPNQFIRSIKKNGKIELFGKGEELRDHIWIDDVSRSIFKILKNKKTGEYNLVTGKAVSFYNISKMIINKYHKKSKIVCKKRKIPMPHNGYRVFKKSKILNIFSDLKFKTFDQVVEKLL